ncbi:hypothetical protein U9M48_021840 [Paspalum notatum var. saurae]|uniref:Cyanobacterial aminoacyl-tRNA synthetase CAAD domain-containing protein n=1 Tax=Paspalum notatum var. saurae TaxID=547442 RepID=A0AAQ3TIJ5_PASNO
MQCGARGATRPAIQHHPKPNQGGLPPQKEPRERQRTGESMELCVSTAAAVPLSFAPLRRGASASTAVPLRRRLPTRGWRCASAAVPDPVPSEEPASAYTTTVVVTDKPDSPADADDKVVEEVCPEPSGSVSVEEPVAELVSSEASPSPSPSPDDAGLDDIADILSKLNIEVTPTLILTGSGAFVALLILTSVVSAIDKVPLLPKLLELVGTGYSFWFTARYLLFKESRDEMFAKFEDLKQRII